MVVLIGGLLNKKLIIIIEFFLLFLYVYIYIGLVEGFFGHGTIFARTTASRSYVLILSESEWKRRVGQWTTPTPDIILSHCNLCEMQGLVHHIFVCKIGLCLPHLLNILWSYPDEAKKHLGKTTASCLLTKMRDPATSVRQIVPSYMRNP